MTSENRFEPKLVGFLCNWCSYAGADLAGTSRTSYPQNVRIIRVPCSGRVDPLFVVKAFQDGADGVMVLGCHPGDCHYQQGNYFAQRRYALMHRLLEFTGLEEGRLFVDWVSASEGKKFADVVTAFTERVRALGPSPLRDRTGGVWNLIGRTPADKVHPADAEMSFGVRPVPAQTELGSVRSVEVAACADEIHPTVEEQIRTAARQWLEKGADGTSAVSFVIGYERGPRGKVRPAFIYKPEEADRLVWGPECDLDLVTYLHDHKVSPRRGVPVPKVGIVVRPCDARAINLLIYEQQIKRENIKVIGVVCPGSEAEGHERPPCQTNQRSVVCQERVPVVYDVLVKADEPVSGELVQDTYSDIVEMDGWTPTERLAFWVREFDRCVRCYACRQACPGCYCYECVAEQVDPHWTSIALQLPEKHFFHVMRAFHLAGRCVGCNACEAACPMGIPLSRLNRKLAKEVEALFGYRTGDDPKTAPPLATFDPEERLRL